MSYVEGLVCNDIQQRASLGLEKYGTSMERTDLSKKEWLQHAYEETLDKAVYLKKLIELEEDTLSQDDKVSLIALVDVVQNNFEMFRTEKYGSIKQKLKDALKLD